MFKLILNRIKFDISKKKYSDYLFVLFKNNLLLFFVKFIDF